MAKLNPDYYIHRVTEISPQFLEERGITALILDVDNTLTTHDNPVPMQDITLWLERMKENGIGMMIVSNNTPQRVRPFAEILGLPFVADGKKPSVSGLARAAQEMGATAQQCAVVGDQIFTDIWGGNRFGALTIMVAPLGPETVTFIKLKRIAEKVVLLGRKPEELERV